MVTRCRCPPTVCSSTNVLLRLPTLMRKPGVRVSLYSICPLSGALSARKVASWKGTFLELGSI